MTSHDRSRSRLQDQLDVKISWVLRASVSDAQPPLHLWQRIIDRLDREAGIGRARPWRELCLACRGLALWLLDSAVDLPPEFAYCYRPRLSDVRDRDYLRLLMYQCDLPMQLGHAM